MKSVMVLLIVLMMGGCASRSAPTFPYTTVEAVRLRLAEGCTSRGLLVEDAGVGEIVCAMSAPSGAVFAAGFGGGDAVQGVPERKVRFIVCQTGSNVVVTAHEWVETDTGFGHVRRSPVDDDWTRDRLRAFLTSLGAK